MSRTRVYIDGYNLYYGCLKGTNLKWLDLLTLFENHILPSISLNGAPLKFVLEPTAVKFFTAEILDKAAKATDSIRCQEQYHSALRKHHPARVEIITGYYSLTEARMRVIDQKDKKKWPRDCSDVEVWKIEEKQTDVNIAIHALRDALLGQVDHVVIVTNDTDIAPALEMIRSNSNVMVGLVIPTTGGQRSPNVDLSKHAHWVRTGITTLELQAAQLPRVVKHSKRPAVKPTSWHPHPAILAKAIALATDEKGSTSKAFQWLTSPNPHYGGQTPLELIDGGSGDQVIAFLEGWAKAKSPAPQLKKGALLWLRGKFAGLLDKLK